MRETWPASMRSRAGGSSGTTVGSQGAVFQRQRNTLPGTKPGGGSGISS